MCGAVVNKRQIKCQCAANCNNGQIVYMAVVVIVVVVVAITVNVTLCGCTLLIRHVAQPTESWQFSRALFFSSLKKYLYAY